VSIIELASCNLLQTEDKLDDTLTPCKRRCGCLRLTQYLTQIFDLVATLTSTLDFQNLIGSSVASTTSSTKVWFIRYRANKLPHACPNARTHARTHSRTDNPKTQCLRHIGGRRHKNYNRHFVVDPLQNWLSVQLACTAEVW